MYKTLIVLESEDKLEFEGAADIVSFDKYLRNYPKLNEGKTRIINLCDTSQYLSKGYYCSLLAEARNHKVLPSVKTINELRASDVIKDEIESIKAALAKLELGDGEHVFAMFFGRSELPQLQTIASGIFSKFPAPIIMLAYTQNGTEHALQISRCSYSQLSKNQQKQFSQGLQNFTQTVWRLSTTKKRHRWDMAILVNPEEKVPPSDKEAISRFIRAASKLGIYAEPSTINELKNISHYDALFIRETTAIDHHTYRLARKADDSGVIVMDDPTSILRCCNKVYLHDAFNYQKVPSLKTEVISNASKESISFLEENFSYPFVLKMPEGSFSKGVYKVNDQKELKEKLETLFQQSALVLAQEYLYTEFDWRVGILNGRAIYACRYLMARNHWQIYNHDATKRFFSGGFETLPTFEVPKRVLDAALKAANIVGSGLYGVDVKEHAGKAYVLEVNDNPSIDHDVEDKYLGNELYMQIMAEFQRRLEARGR